ncbi:BLOC-2 complex member HPS5 homolog [Condylostylus longicornis]|uniref:BLOC-2 complex member HPS5 homolog n=1 Tax=Condylostylus longicornis TaxID=2530218 RepID=UPI00244E2107|nr:BLOC-2 complex member HPS5 homolog [Condylostylus longicornis]
MNDIFTLSNYFDYTSLINEPLKHTQRIKYTCFDASPKYFIFGATSGSLYLFNRKPGFCKFLHLIPTKYGPINQVLISPGEKLVAFATTKGVICVYVINLSANSPPQIITTGFNSEISQITSLHWHADERQFYFGDKKGQVNLVTLTYFMGRTLLNLSVHPILFLESPVVQISDFESLLLISNSTKCILCNTEYEEYKQIGNRPRDGDYGACFTISSNENVFPSRIYCARPGSRIWEVDLEGNVLKTHQFKQALACPPINFPKIYTSSTTSSIMPSKDERNKSEEIADNDSDYQNKEVIESGDEVGTIDVVEYYPQNLQFAKLQTIRGDFIFTYTDNGLYIFDMRQSKVVLWSNRFDRIADCRIVGVDEILVFTVGGFIYSMRLQILQTLAVELVQQAKYLECSWLMKKNLKYFAEKAKEDYDLVLLNDIKSYLMNTNQYELLNDLSVIFDSITQAENELSSGSGSGSIPIDRRSNSSKKSGSSNNKTDLDQQSINSTLNGSENGVYILENAFCDNLKLNSDREKHFKDALLTVTGKFGKNIIKYKFNIFSDEQKKLVNDLIPSSVSAVKSVVSTASGQTGSSNNQLNSEIISSEERDLHYQNINFTMDSKDDEEIVVKKSSRKVAATSDNDTINTLAITNEEKTIYNLFLICRSSKISNTNFLDRYSCVFDLYTSNEIINILNKLEKVMREHGDAEIDAKANCYEMYFNYLKPELIYEFDKESLEYIINGFCLLNTQTSTPSGSTQNQTIIRCDSCDFPVRFSNSCRYHELGEVLFKFLWSRNDQQRCFDILKQVPAMFDVICRFYITDMNFAKVIPISLNYCSAPVFEEAAKYYDITAWNKCFEIFAMIQKGQFNCINCEKVVNINVDRHFFYTWNCFLNLALQFLDSEIILDYIENYAHLIPNDAIDKDFYLKCLANASIDYDHEYSNDSFY